MTTAILAIDQGTTNSKAVLVSTAGEILSRGSSPVGIEHPQPGWVEQNPMRVWESVKEAIASCLQAGPAHRHSRHRNFQPARIRHRMGCGYGRTAWSGGQLAMPAQCAGLCRTDRGRPCAARASIDRSSDRSDVPRPEDALGCSTASLQTVTSGSARSTRG